MNQSDLYLNKWFLDFVGDNGEVMIFYSAQLKFKAITVHYSSWIHHTQDKGLEEKTHFTNVHLPELQEDIITWNDQSFKVKGTWQSKVDPINARLFEDDSGYLDWHCHQPASRVKLEFDDRVIEGTGYGEQLILTAYPWHIPMDHLRWGRFHAPEHTLVWIEIREKEKEQWVWLNGSPIDDTLIEDGQIVLQDQGLVFELDRNTVLESENKIFNVVKSLLQFIPGFNNDMTSKFLMATNHKWMSEGEVIRDGNQISTGTAIHEWVNFSNSNK